MRENEYQAKLKKRIKTLLPGCVIIKVDDIQGFPDLLILYDYKWAALEVKRNPYASHRPNQDCWVQRLDDMSFASFIYPENEEDVLNALQQSLRT